MEVFCAEKDSPTNDLRALQAAYRKMAATCHSTAEWRATSR
jgi:hypothetical protein